MKMLKINEGQRGAGGNYYLPRLLTQSASAITWQSTKTPNPFSAESKYRVRLQRGRQQHPAHKNERHSALDEAAAMRSNGPENQPEFPAARVNHTAHASTGAPSAADSTARAPLQPHLHFLHATPRHTLHRHLSPAPRHEGHVHIGRRSGQSLARGRHTAEQVEY
jgi:hypothetical protein